VKEPSIVLAGGGTAGHISPMVSIGEALRRKDSSARVLMIGSDEGMETRLVPAAGYPLRTIAKVPMPRRPSPDMLAFPGRFRRAVKAAERILREEEADVVVGVGGYVCTPVYLAARKAGIPVIVHEANTTPGLANRVGNRFSAFTGVAFEGTALKRAQWVGMPMDRRISQLDRSEARDEARTRLGLDPERPTLVVTGGSSGALSLNRAIGSTIEELTGTGAQVLHLTGVDKQVRDDSGHVVKRFHYHQREYLDGMADAYAAADLIVARAGAATVCEVAAVGLPAVFVPLPIGNGEQERNARDLVDAGGALLVKDEHFSEEWIRRNILPLLEQPELLATMQRQSSQRGITDADDRMAEAAMEAIQR
jgi:UDP-N-acetylglucosamine--N-acetylmuramyl-(pentapeptide) pyrophosphoryl-undecaprenol N-acetylglucosamine transferase